MVFGPNDHVHHHAPHAWIFDPDVGGAGAGESGDAGEGGEGGEGGDGEGASKKKKKKKKGLQQTDPPTIPIHKFFPSGIFPEGEIQQYDDRCAARTHPTSHV